MNKEINDLVSHPAASLKGWQKLNNLMLLRGLYGQQIDGLMGL